MQDTLSRTADALDVEFLKAHRTLSEAEVDRRTRKHDAAIEVRAQATAMLLAPHRADHSDQEAQV